MGRSSLRFRLSPDARLLLKQIRIVQNRMKNRGWRKFHRATLKRDRGKCRACGNTRNLAVHHIVPYSISARHSLDNLITLCGSCHAKAEASFDRYVRAYGEDVVFLLPYLRFCVGNSEPKYVMARNVELELYCRTDKAYETQHDWKHIEHGVMERDNHRCRCCSRTTEIQVVHVVPYRISKCSAPWNLLVLCSKCKIELQRSFEAYETTFGTYELVYYVPFLKVVTDGKSVYYFLDLGDDEEERRRYVLGRRVFPKALLFPEKNPKTIRTVVQ